MENGQWFGIGKNENNTFNYKSSRLGWAIIWLLITNFLFKYSESRLIASVHQPKYLQSYNSRKLWDYFYKE